MNKIIQIIKREYLTRVRKKTFLISTILFPLLYVALIFGTAFIGAKSIETVKVAVIDPSAYFSQQQFDIAGQNDSTVQLKHFNTAPKNLNTEFKKMGFDGYVSIPATFNWEEGLKNIKLKSEKKFGPATVSNVENRLNSCWSEIKNEKLGIDSQKREILKNSRVNIESENLEGKASNEKTAGMVGFVGGFLMYFMLLLYGSQVMMGVMEEKTSRIAEVIISSVRPFQLMLGKIVGICFVALTQFFLWIALVFLIYQLTSSNPEINAGIGGMVGQIKKVFSSINLPVFLVLFLFYMIGGFFFYASLYAAIGCAVNEDVREAQSLSFPITMMIIFCVAMMSAVMNNPTGSIAFWGSILPFSSPIIMIALLPFGVPETIPWWQLLVSMALLVVGFITATWFAGKIYRTGILMYGKKPNWKDLIKWAFAK